MKPWSNLARVVYQRTYSRSDSRPDGRMERWTDTCDRAIHGNLDDAYRAGVTTTTEEVARLRYYLYERKAIPAGRGLWFSGTRAHGVLGGAALNNCWFTTSARVENFCWAQDMLMLGGGVGMSVESRFTGALPKVHRGVAVKHKLDSDGRPAKDADYIVPDSREGWVELTRRVLDAYLHTGRSFTYSTVVIRGYGESIKGFGGTSSGPAPVIRMVEKLAGILDARAGQHLRPLDAADIICSIGEMVKMGNVRRSALIVLGDPWDREFLQAKRWDLGTLPTQRAEANFSVVAGHHEDLHPAYWRTFDAGEPFGLVNRDAIQRHGRIGEFKPDTAIGVNPCGEATLEDHEPCNLQELALPNLADLDELVEAARLMHRWGRRVTMARYYDPVTAEVVARNRRVGTSVTGVLAGGKLAWAEALDCAYKAIHEENIATSKVWGIPPSIRTTTIKPSGTVSKLLDLNGCEGVHAPWSRYYVQRIRIAANDPLIPYLRACGHHIEPEKRFDGSRDLKTLVVDFYVDAGAEVPTADGAHDTWQQLEALQKAQKAWADQSVSVTVTYERGLIPALKSWVADNLGDLKSVSFLCHSDHGFEQAPKESITSAQYEELSKRITPLPDEADGAPNGVEQVQLMDCENGACPVR